MDARICAAALALALGLAHSAVARDKWEADRWENLSIISGEDRLIAVRLDKDTVLRNPSGADVWIQHLLIGASNKVSEIALFRQRIDCNKRMYAMLQQVVDGRSVPVAKAHAQMKSPAPGSLAEDVVSAACNFLQGTAAK